MLYFRIFDRDYLKSVPVTGVFIPRDLDYLRRQYNYVASVIQNYYLTRNFAVKNTHVLSRFLEHFPLLLDMDYYDFLNVLESRVTYLSKTFKFTSGIEAGIVHPPYFYGNNGESIITSYFDPPNKYEALSNWKTIRCCEVITHPRNDTKLLTPNGTNDGSKGGLSCVSINLATLGVKYREFVREQNNKIRGLDDDPNSQVVILNKKHFVSKYVIPGLIESHIDHMLLNRIIDTYYGNEIITPSYNHQFALPTFDTQLNRYIGQIIDYITKTDLNFTNILNCIPLMFSTNANELLSLSNVPNTRQSNWAFVVSRLKYMCFLLDVAKKPTLSTTDIEDWRLLVKRMERDNAMLGNFTSTEYKLIKGYFEKIKNFKYN